MLKFNAAAFYDAMSTLMGVQAIVETTEAFDKSLKGISGAPYDPDSAHLGAQAIELGRKHLDALQNELNVLGTPLTAMAVRRLTVRLYENDAPTHRNFSDAVAEINARLKDELSAVCTLVLSQERAKYFEPKEPLFGQEINDRLPLAVPDIEDAGRCIAVNQGTAAVFHLMRVMEAALKALGKLLGIPYAPSWESYITQITARISAKHKTKGVQWKRDEAFYRDIAGDLQTIKIAWRNPTMHIVRRYSTDEAEEIFRAVRGFLVRLASKLPKQALSETDLWPDASTAQSS